MRLLRVLLVAIGLAGTPVHAAGGPVIAPAEPWVERLAVPSAAPAEADKPFQALLLTAQSRHGEESEYYIEWATLVQTPQGLAQMGNLVIPWQPDRSELLVHKVEIIRAGKSIDLLAAGQEFTVLRRENNLESAQLDGVLTAVMQPEGLSVGDIVHVAYTVRTKPGTIPFRPEHWLGLGHGLAARRLFYREVWPDGAAIRWHASAALGTPRLKKGRWGNELVLDLHDAQGPKPAESAPSRFQMPAYLDLSGYADWADISKLLAPAYASARRIGPNSPLQAEIRRIAAASADPRQRAMAALRLVEDQIRYLALAMGDGGYVPATAEQTWARKFGDCKGKTVTLLALLDGLGIEAEPVLVNSQIGDWLPERLPQVGLFDHVIVRAAIGGRAYFLDGTRSGDRDLEALADSPFRWGLPLTAAGAKLEALPLAPPALPLMETRTTYDASQGFFTPVQVTGELVYRGDMATAMRMVLQQVGPDEFRKRAREMVPNSSESDSVQYDFRSDEERGSFTISYSGRQQMDWSGGPGARRVTFHFDSDTIRWRPDFKREEGPGKDYPFALAFPLYVASTETVILPRGGAGFTLEGKSFDRIVAGTRIARTISLENGRASARSIFQGLKPEISAAEAAAGEQALREINADVAGVRSPDNYEMSAGEKQALAERVPVSAQEYNRRGYEFLQAGELAKAMADFAKAASLSPGWSLPEANRGIVLIHQRKFDQAEAALKRAETLNANDFVVHQGFGLLNVERDKPAEAVEEFTRALQLDPDNKFTLMSRAMANEQLGKLVEALTDVERIIALDPNAQNALWESARLHTGLRHAEAALAANSKLIALDPKNALFVGNRGELLYRLDRKAEAMEAWGKAISLIDDRLRQPDADENLLLQQKIAILTLMGEPQKAVAVATARLRRFVGSVPLLTARCSARADGAIELLEGLKDCDDAIRFDPGYVEAFVARGMLKLRLDKWDEAIADYDAALALRPHSARAFYGRGMARLRKGDREAGERDLATARRQSFDIDAEYAPTGLVAPASAATR